MTSRISGPGFICRTCRRRNTGVTSTKKEPHSVLRWRRCPCGVSFRTLEIRLDDISSTPEFDKFFTPHLPRPVGRPRKDAGSEKKPLTPTPD